MLYSRGIVRIGNLTDDQVDFCKRVLSLHDILISENKATYVEWQEGDNENKIEVLELANTKKVFDVAESLFEVDGAEMDSLYFDSGTGEAPDTGWVELWDEYSFDVELISGVIQILLAAIDSKQTVFFSWVGTDDNGKPDYPTGGVAAVNSTSILILDGGHIQHILLPDLIEHTGVEQESCYGDAIRCPTCKSDDTFGDFCAAMGFHTMMQKMACNNCGANWNNISLLVSKQVTYTGELSDG